MHVVIWFLVPQPLWNPACTSGSSQFTYCWSLAWRILSIPLLACEKNTIVLISYASKVTLKILKVRLQQYMNQGLPDVQVGFRKGRGTRDQIANIHWIIEKQQENSRKISTYASLTTLKPLTVCITTNCGKFWKRWEHQTTLPASWEMCMQVKKQQLELDMDWSSSSPFASKGLVPNWERSTSRLYIVTLFI